MNITEAEKKRRRTLLNAHYEAENNHDMKGIMKTFSENAEMLINRQQFSEPKSIVFAHGAIGFSNTHGAFRDIHNFIDGEHFTENEIIVEGRLCGKHVGDFKGIPASGKSVELPFVAFYYFDSKDKLVSERVVMNLGALISCDCKLE